MKKLLFISLSILLGISFTGRAQDFEIGGSVGYMMSGQLYLIEGDADITNNVSYGGFTHYYVADNVLVQLLYLRKDTKIDYTSFFLNIDETYDLSVEYYHLGGIKTFGSNEKVKPFVSFSMGATRFHLKDVDQYDDEWRFSIAPSVGVKVYLSDKIGLQAQARLLMPLTFEGYGIFWSSSGGSGASVGFSVPVWQGDFSGGLFIRLN